jgi:hypothetical protein
LKMITQFSHSIPRLSIYASYFPMPLSPVEQRSPIHLSDIWSIHRDDRVPTLYPSLLP